MLFAPDLGGELLALCNLITDGRWGDVNETIRRNFSKRTNLDRKYLRGRLLQQYFLEDLFYFVNNLKDPTLVTR